MLTKTYLLVFIIALFPTLTQIYAQGGGTAYCVKGGLTVGLQNWGGNSKDPLIAWNTAIQLESLNESKIAFYAHLGYHVKGSAQRGFASNAITGQRYRYNYTQKFNNASLILGVVGKNQQSAASTTIQPYYLLGGRVDYTISTDFALYNIDESLINKINYGLSLGGGINIPIKKIGAIQLEALIGKDFSNQIYQRQVVIYDRNTNNPITIPELKVQNTSFELTLGYKFYRRVEWVDSELDSSVD